MAFLIGNGILYQINRVSGIPVYLTSTRAHCILGNNSAMHVGVKSRKEKFQDFLSIIIPRAYEICRGVYSFHLSVHLSMCPSGVNILRQSFV